MNAEIVGLLGEHMLRGRLILLCDCGLELLSPAEHRAHLASVLEAWAGERVRSVLEDLSARMTRAVASLGTLAAEDNRDVLSKARLDSKGQGVALAHSYIDEAIRQHRADKEGDT